MTENKRNKLEGNDKCPACRKEFHCSKSGKCWCFEEFITEDKRAEINQKYDRCLCPECLKDYTKGA